MNLRNLRMTRRRLNSNVGLLSNLCKSHLLTTFIEWLRESDGARIRQNAGQSFLNPNSRIRLNGELP